MFGNIIMKHHIKTLTIITDSLSLSRDCTPIESTWVDRFMQTMGGGAKIYFFPQRGRHTKDIILQKQDLLTYQKADIVIIQVGVVDACRRIIKRGWERILLTLPITRYLYKIISKRLMFHLTSLYEFHYVSPTCFKENIYHIAPPGKKLIEKVYNIQEDINHYNAILEECSLEKHFTIAQAFKDCDKNHITIADGHHLSRYGHSLVLNCLVKILKSRAFERI